MSQFLAAIGGAVVGGLIAYFIQIKVLRENRKTRQEDRRSTDQVLANSLIVKVIKIYSSVHMIHSHIEQCFERAETHGIGDEPWTFVQPLANRPLAVDFTAEEMGMVLSKDHSVFNAVLPLDTIHNMLWETLTKMQNKRAILLERIPRASFEGNIAHASLDKQQELRLRPQMIAVNELIGQLQDHSSRALRDTKEALDSLHSLLKDSLNLDYSLETVDLSDN